MLGNRLALAVCLAAAVLSSGCGLSRNDFVCGPDGKPAGPLSDSGAALGAGLKVAACVAAGAGHAPPPTFSEP
jgi:hypothetical protein